LPNLVGVRGQVDLTVRVTVEDPRLLVIEVDDQSVVRVVLEEGFVSADDLSILPKPPANAISELDDAVYAIYRKKRIATNPLRGLADAIDAPSSLDQSDDRP